MVAAVVVAIVWMSLIKDGEGDSTLRRYQRRVGVAVLLFVVAVVVLWLMPTAVIVDSTQKWKVMKVAGSPSVETEWGTEWRFVISLDGLEHSEEYVVNKTPDTLILFPLIYSKEGYKAYDSHNLTREVLDIPPLEYRKVDYDISTFFVIPDEELLKVTSQSRGKNYALMTRPQLSELLNQIIVVQMTNDPLPEIQDDFTQDMLEDATSDMMEGY